VFGLVDVCRDGLEIGKAVDSRDILFCGGAANVVVDQISMLDWEGVCCVPRDEINWNDFSHYPTIFGTCSFALEGIALILPIKSKMHNTGQFVFTMSTGMLIVTALYWGVGLGSYYMFGDATLSPIIQSLPPTAIAKVAKVALSLSIFFSFPFQFFPITEYIDKTLSTSYRVDPRSLTFSRDLIAQSTVSTSSPYDIDAVNIATPAPQDGLDQALAENGENGQNGLSGVNPNDLIGLHTSELAIESAQSRVFQFSLVARYIILAVTAFVAIVFPDFKLIIALFGSFANSSLAFIFPTIFWILILAQGRRHIVNSPQYFRLAVSQSSFQLRNVYYYDRTGRAIDVETILQGNLDRMEAYESAIPALGDNVTPQHSPRGAVAVACDSSSNSTRPSPATSRAASYGSFDGDSAPTDSPAVTKLAGAPVNLYQEDDIDDVRVNTASNGATKARGANNQETSPLFAQSLSINTDSTESATSSGFSREKHGNVEKVLTNVVPIPKCEYIMNWVAFPLCVAVVGIIASGIGVVDSVKDIIHEFSK
jgi:hypothetical protein